METNMETCVWSHGSGPIDQLFSIIVWRCID